MSGNRITNSDRQRAQQSALSQIEKAFGKGPVMRLGSDESERIEAISTGCLSLDVALGIGGLPRGRITEIFGPELSGKTTLALHVIAEAQRKGGIALFIDAEHTFDVDYARSLSVDTDRLYISTPSSGEEALETMDTMIRSNGIDVIVLDSVAALVPMAELEGNMGASFVGSQARMMSQALRKLSGSISKSNSIAIFINQLRKKIGDRYGNPETEPGGRALKFWSSVRLEVRRGDAINVGNDQIGTRTKVLVVKNKVSPTLKSVEFDMIFGKGISQAGDLLDVATANNVIGRASTDFTYGGVRLGQGRDNAVAFLEDNDDLRMELDQELRFLLLRQGATAMNPQSDLDQTAVSQEPDSSLKKESRSSEKDARRKPPKKPVSLTWGDAESHSQRLGVGIGESNRKDRGASSLLEETFGDSIAIQSLDSRGDITLVIGMKLNTHEGVAIWTDTFYDPLLAGELHSTFVDVTFALHKDTSAYQEERAKSTPTKQEQWLTYTWKTTDGSVCTLRSHPSNMFLIGHWRIRNIDEQSLIEHLLPIAKDWRQSKLRLLKTVRGILGVANL